MNVKKEYRHHPRLSRPFPITVRGVDAKGEWFEVHTQLDNISGGGLYIWLARRVELGAKLFMVVVLSLSRDGSVKSGPCVALQGRVVRTEPQPDGTWGIAMAFTHHRFL